VYRSIETLLQRELIAVAGHERGQRGPNRTIYGANEVGDAAVRRCFRNPSSTSATAGACS
jgi:hypothetical protein